ncbi:MULTISPECIES: hypothetical protein [Kocuria]|nr:MULTISPECIES: hypothetical protein [Kocuria]
MVPCDEDDDGAGRPRVPVAADGTLVAGDETALPAIAHWLEE